MNRTRSRLRRGMTMIETITASAVGVLVIFTSVMAMISGMGTWAKGQSKINADLQSQRAIRAIAINLREAMAVTVDNDGNGLTYRLPKFDGTGNIIAPIEWDNVERRIVRQDGKIYVGPTGSLRVLAKDVITTDPVASGTPSYKLFESDGATVVRRLNVMVATKTISSNNQTVTSRVRETIYLRNVPILSK